MAMLSNVRLPGGLRSQVRWQLRLPLNQVGYQVFERFTGRGGDDRLQGISYLLRLLGVQGANGYVHVHQQPVPGAGRMVQQGSLHRSPFMPVIAFSAQRRPGGQD